MKFGTRLYGADPESLLEKATRAEELGFESLWRGDHLLLPTASRSAYPYATGGSVPFSPDAPVLDVVTLFAFVAAATTRVRLATGVLVLPLRDVVAVARAVQTLDIVSHGRVVVGVGAGWLEEEFTAVGRDFHHRGEILTEGIDVLKALWTEEQPAFAGRHLAVSGVRFEPKPSQRPHPPIIVGGESPAALRRAATQGDGWYGHQPTPAHAAEVVRTLDSLRREAGRAHLPFEVTVRAHPAVSLDDLKGLEQAGVDRVVAEIGSFDRPDGPGDVDAMEAFAVRVLDAWA